MLFSAVLQPSEPGTTTSWWGSPAVTDGVLRAYVEEVVACPDRQGTQVGQALMDCLMATLGAIPVVTLFCSPELVPFYELQSFAAPSRSCCTGVDPRHRPDAADWSCTR